jgi:hypothetical protein
MNSETDLLQKLMISKKIMEKHNEIGRGNARDINMGSSSPMVESFEAPAAKYNLPQEFLQEQQKPQQIVPNLPMEDRIASSKLPDEIKRLMLEHPIQQPTMGMGTNTVLSDELVEKASRLMNSNAKGEQIKQPTGKRQQIKENQNSNVDINEIKSVIRETVEDVLFENGLLVESEKNSSEVFKFRVGQHIFEGKVTKIRKVAK